MIKLYRLTTGEDVVGKAVEGDEIYQKVEKPFVLIPMQGQPGQPMTIGFHPYIPYSKDEVIAIKKNNIIAESNPDESILNAYENNTSKIITAKKPKLIT